ncbi:acetyl-CoA carboxylase biotin carboxyl carrier protein [Pediococcus siamensis]|uniref:acetyl-CoA carboxylase biotin carboxyl carrier protein n=1 Tax=Pediococcus siamensis TaxID=381829 RepID=UPI0039A01BD4
MDLAALNQLLDKLEKMNFSEVELEFDQVKLHVKKGDQTKPVVADPVSPAAASETKANEFAIKSPMVGVIHFENQLKVGQLVTGGEVVAQIESMKLFNDVTAPEPGTIKQVHVKNGDSVEYGQPLVTLVKGNANV